MTSRVKYILGAIAGDIMGSVYEGSDLKRYDIDLFTEKADFTDDTVLTIATMDCLLKAEDYSTMYRNYARQFPGRGYGCCQTIPGHTIVMEMVLRCALVL